MTESEDFIVEYVEFKEQIKESWTDAEKTYYDEED